ncbi:MAG TPA: hypothetical protein VGA15_22115, partial [Bradyrhizobium sp.]
DPLSKSRWSIFERNGPVSPGKRASYHGSAQIPQLGIALRQLALAFAEMAKLSPGALYHTAPQTAKHLGVVNHGIRSRVP